MDRKPQEKETILEGTSGASTPGEVSPGQGLKPMRANKKAKQGTRLKLEILKSIEEVAAIAARIRDLEVSDDLKKKIAQVHDGLVRELNSLIRPVEPLK